MSIRNQIAWAVAIIGAISLAFGISLTDLSNHTGDSGDLSLGCWLLVLGLLAIFSSLPISDWSTNRIKTDNLDSHSQDSL